jgi:isopentenyl diphosphate isomerase/L-lactate dehydrogenase-like FMN-dependent dehydrogenase
VTKALSILEAELVRTLQLMGVKSVAELDGSFVRVKGAAR